MRSAQASEVKIGCKITMRHKAGYGSVDDPRVFEATYTDPEPVDGFDAENG
jgi:hypothetical protein